MRAKGRSTTTRPAAAFNLRDFLKASVYPHLGIADVFTHASHQFRGNDHKVRGGCPWHDSQSRSSFYVDLPGMLWRCAGCNVGGAPVDYVHMLVYGPHSKPEGPDFIAAARRLCELAGVEFPERELSPQEQAHARRYETRRAVLAAVYAECRALLLSAAGGEARKYLASRGLDNKDADALGLGLYPALPALRRGLLKAGFSEQDLGSSFCVVAGLGGYITFPWHDDGGRPLTLYGRWPGKPPAGRQKTYALPNPKDDDARDWEHTKRSPLYLDRALRSGHRDVVLVEGVIDAALAQARGDERTVACVAGLLSEGQLKTLARRRVKSAVVCLDPDQAGDNNIISNVRHLIAAGVDAYVAPRLPPRQDPDEFILANGVDAWARHVGQAVHGYRHVARAIVRKHGGAA